jgi:hypothetical protein
MKSLSVIAWIVLSVGAADAAKLTFSFADAAGDGTSSGDLQGMRFHFDDVTGFYSIELRAHPAQPFAGDLRFNVNLFDPDTGTSAPNPAFFQATNNDFALASPAARIILTGTDFRLLSWAAGDRVAANHVPFGNPSGGTTSFATGLVDLPGPGTFCAAAQDCLGPLDASNFTTITELSTVFDNFDPSGGGFHPFNSSVAATSFNIFFGSVTDRAAARFTVSGGPYRLDSITLPIGKEGVDPNPLLRVRLTEDAGLAPGATLEVLSENEDLWPAIAGAFTSTTTLTSTAGTLLEPGESYWIVTEPTAIQSQVTVGWRWFHNSAPVQAVARLQNQNGALPADPWPGLPTNLPLAFRVDGVLVECDDGADNDQDGLADALDPGCADPTDLSERDPTLPCDDGADNDGDGGVDHHATQGDPACQTPTSTREDAACDDDADNDGDGRIDWDGGSSAATPDPQCAGKPWRNNERPNSCGLGAELLLPLALLLVRRPV